MTTATAFESSPVPGVPRSVTFFAIGQSEPGRIRLSTHSGQGELVFRFAHTFTIERVADEAALGMYSAKTSFYQYRILDYEENEIVIYDWHPSGASPVTVPHLHVSAAGSIVLRQRAGSPLYGRKTVLGSFHLPTAHILLEDVVELLIGEFSVDPLRSDWQRILRQNRDTITQSWAH